MFRMERSNSRSISMVYVLREKKCRAISRVRRGILCSFHGPLAQPTTTRPRKVLVEPSTLYARKAALRREPRGHARFGWIPAMIICNACIEPSGRSRIFEVLSWLSADKPEPAPIKY